MGSISGSFSANGVSSTLALGNTPESISLTLAGTFSGKVYLERAMSTAAQAWEVVGGPYTAAGTFNYLARPTDILRARMKNYVSGTVSFTPFGQLDAATGTHRLLHAVDHDPHAGDPAVLEAFDRLLDAKLSSRHGPQTA